MNLTITINDATDEDKEKLREAFKPFVKAGLVKIRKYADSDRQEWDFFDPQSLTCALRALSIRINYVNTLIDYKETRVNTDYFNNHKTNLDSKILDASEACKTAQLVNEKQTSSIQDQRPAQRSGKEKGGEQLTLFNPEISMRENVKAFIEFWNERFWIPSIKGTDRQCHLIAQAFKRPCFRDNYCEAIRNIGRSKFLRGVGGRGFKISIDWFLIPDNFDKTLEGKYFDSEPDKSTLPIKDRKFEDETI